MRRDTGEGTRRCSRTPAGVPPRPLLLNSSDYFLQHFTSIADLKEELSIN